MSVISQQPATIEYLATTFEDLDQKWITQLISNFPTARMEFLTEQCVARCHQINAEKSIDNNKNNQNVNPNKPQLIGSSFSCDEPCYNVQQCSELKSLQQILQANNTGSPNQHAIILLDNFCHLLEHHEKDFEFVFKQLGGFCDIRSCNQFNCKRKCKSKTDEEEWIPFYQIIDKIHCYFRHSFDIGFRIPSKQLTNDRQKLEHKRNQNFENRSSRYIHPIDAFNDNTLKKSALSPSTGYIPVEHDSSHITETIIQEFSYHPITLSNLHITFPYHTTDTYVHYKSTHNQITLSFHNLCPMSHEIRFH